MAGDGRHDADHALAALVAGGMTHEQAADAVGVSSRTVARRMKSPEFRALLDQARADLMDSLADGGPRAARKLVLLLDHKDAKVVLGAARTLLEHCLKGFELADLAEQLADLRRRLDGTGDAAASDPRAAGEGGPADDAGHDDPAALAG